MMTRQSDGGGMKIGQSRKGSIMEAYCNVVVGYWIAFATQVITFPLFGLHASLGDNLGIGLIFTVVSLVRSYCLRRFFNWWHTR